MPFNVRLEAIQLHFHPKHKKSYWSTENRLEIENLILHANGVDECTTKALNNLHAKQKKFEELIYERMGFHTQKIGWIRAMFFLNLQYRNATKKKLQKIFTNDGESLISPKEV